MRLTEKDTQENHYSIKPINPDVAFDFEALIKAYDKLGQLEDIEDELGIDLITLFKALENGIWVKKTNAIEEVFYDREKVGSFSFYFKEIYVEHECEYQYPYALKDYGITWALTKEELL